jgi:hypothetical protein
MKRQEANVAYFIALFNTTGGTYKNHKNSEKRASSLAETETWYLMEKGPKLIS